MGGNELGGRLGELGMGRRFGYGRYGLFMSERDDGFVSWGRRR